MRMKQIVIFGSTGSVGTKALQICERNPESFKVIGLTTNTNIKKLLEQINQFRPRYVAITDDNARNEFTKYKPPFVQVLSVDELSCIKVDCVINGMVGISGLKPSMNVLKTAARWVSQTKSPSSRRADFSENKPKDTAPRLFPSIRNTARFSSA